MCDRELRLFDAAHGDEPEATFRDEGDGLVSMSERREDGMIEATYYTARQMIASVRWMRARWPEWDWSGLNPA